MAESFFREAEDHDRSCAETVGDDVACVRNGCLGEVDVEDVKASGAQNPVDDFKLSVVSLEVFGLGKFCKGVFGDVVLCRSKSSCYYHDVVCTELFAERIDYDFMVVTYGYHS